MAERIAIVGAGAVGGYLGAQLKRTGRDVVLVDPWPEHVERIRAEGLAISGLTAEECFRVKVEALHLCQVQALSRRAPIDIAIVAAKSYDTTWMTAMIAPYLAPHGFVVSAQNSINEEKIAEIVGWGRTVGCVVANNLALDLVAPGDVRRTMARSPDIVSLFLGEVHGRVTPRLERLRELFAAFDVTRTTTNLWGERWSKLCVNGMRNAVSAATGLGGNERDADPGIRRIVMKLAFEAVRVGEALGYRLEPIAGADPETWSNAARGDRDAIGRVEQAIEAGARSGGRSSMQRPSMAQDIAKGRKTEIAEINGLIAAEGARIGVAAPAHAAIAGIVARIECGELSPGRELVAGI